MLARLGFETAALDAKLLAGHALGLDALAMATREGELVDEGSASRVADLLRRRMSGESVARIIGEKEFYGLAFGLNAATLEPRPDTELLVDLAIKALPKGGRLLDLGTGTGCIPIAILANRADATGMATDLSAEALAMARENAEQHGVVDRLDFAQGSWFEALRSVEDSALLLPPGGGGREGGLHETDARSAPHPKGEGAIASRFHLITANPPYIASAVIETLLPEVKHFDPRLALDGGPDGLAPYRVIASEAARFLKPGGRVLVEIGYDQGEAVSRLFAEHHFADIAVQKDLNGLDRVISAHHMGGVITGQ